MNLAQLQELGAKVFSESSLSGDTGSNLDLQSLGDALSRLTGSNGIDLGSLVNSFNNGGLGELVNSWLGDGENQAISTDQVTKVIGSEKLSEFASQLGLSVEEAAGGLTEALPQMIDKASSGGSLLESFGGIQGAIGLAKKLFGN